MAITCCTKTTSQIRNKIPQISFSKIGSQIASGLSNYIHFPVRVMNQLTVPLSKKIVDVAFNLSGERYQRYCQSRAFSLAHTALTNLPTLKEMPVLQPIAEAPASGCVGKSRKALRDLSNTLSKAASSLDSKAEDLTGSRWKSIQAIGHGAHFLSYPLEGLSYVPAALSQVGEKVKDIPWAARPETDAQRVIAEKIFLPLIKNIDLISNAKQVQMGINLAAGAWIGQAVLNGYSSLKATLESAKVSNAFDTGVLEAGRANALAWIGVPAAAKAIGAFRNIDTALDQLTVKIVEKNPRLTEYFSTIEGFSPGNQKELLTSLVSFVLFQYETKLSWIDLSDKKAVDALCSFPAVNLPVVKPADAPVPSPAVTA